MKMPHAKHYNAVLLSLFSHAVMANESITFKPSFSPKHAGLSYGIALLGLLILLFFMSKKYKPSLIQSSACQLIEKKYVGNKTTIYIIDYQQQRFLLADNQQALALHPIIQKDSQ